MTVLQFPNAGRRPRFVHVGEAMKWFRVVGFDGTVPPVDATGDMDIDGYMAAVFAGIVTWRDVSRVLHILLTRAEAEDRRAMQFIAAGETGAAQFHVTVSAILRKWADEVSRASVEEAIGGAA